jgi:membrane protease YdiL (CAAX protease family)
MAIWFSLISVLGPLVALVMFAFYRTLSEHLGGVAKERTLTGCAAVLGVTLLLPLYLRAEGLAFTGAASHAPASKVLMVSTLATGAIFSLFYAVATAASLEKGATTGGVWTSIRAKGNDNHALVWECMGVALSLVYTILIFNVTDVFTGAQPDSSPFGWIVLQSAASAYSEELFFRGYVQRLFECRFPSVFGQKPAIASNVLTSVLFSAAHLQGPLKFVQVFPFSIFLGVVVRKSGLKRVMAIHFIVDICYALMMRPIVLSFLKGHA